MTAQKTKHKESKAKLVIRNASLEDAEAIYRLADKVYGKSDLPHCNADMIRGQIANYPDGQFVALYEGIVVGYCATFRISGNLALVKHKWKEITGGGFASRHDPDGDYLYGMEVYVDPEYRGLRIGQRLYNERKKLCQYHRLKGIVFAGRMPGLNRKGLKVKFSSPDEYLELVKNKKIRDQVLSFQMRNGFEPIGVIVDYLKQDYESKGCAVHMLWCNPKFINPGDMQNKQRGRLPETVRIACIQYQQRRVSSFDEFKKHVEYFIKVVSDYKADFVVFPEMFTLQLLSLETKKLNPAKAIEALAQHTDAIKVFFSELAVSYNINIIGGSHPTKLENGDVMNICYVCLRDGSIHQQEKIHPTPSEKYWWNIKGGDQLRTIKTDCGTIGVLICYDSEFPELARHLTNQGMQFLFIPFCTDERQSYLRVRYCAQARAVENQCFVAMAGNVGNLPGVDNMEIQYAQSCILAPCDFPFSRDGIAADTTPNVEMIAFADVRLENLQAARQSGTVTNLKDRRFDLYSVNWNEVS